MDPVSQGTVGAAFAQSTANKNNFIKISFIGFLAGLAPDLDVLIRSENDPILFLEYHRQFSHSLFFIPFGALIISLLIFPLVKKSISLKTVYIASFLGYATHGLLDACTSYGTLLFWPFSNERITWNTISIVDPLFTIPALILTGIAIVTRKRIFSFFTIGWIVFYLSLGFIQYERALSAAIKLAEFKRSWR
jgi:inner membrane protein